MADSSCYVPWPIHPGTESGPGADHLDLGLHCEASGDGSPLAQKQLLEGGGDGSRHPMDVYISLLNYGSWTFQGFIMKLGVSHSSV